jgi:hypothetical protein
VVDGQELTFRLLGVNNQNFVMADEQTGTWWQQVTGEALVGPLAGKRLKPMRFDEVSFEIWRGEHPGTLVFEPVPEKADRYLPDDWDDGMDYPVPDGLRPDGEWDSRRIVVGIVAGDRKKAFPLDVLREQTPVADWVGDTPVLISVAADGRSIRAFDRRVDDTVLELYAKPDSEPPMFIDGQTGSEWNFAGIAIAGPMEGRELARVVPLKDYWFDWKNYHPETQVYTAGVAR